MMSIGEVKSIQILAHFGLIEYLADIYVFICLDM
jgi:hypothetical protein